MHFQKHMSPLYTQQRIVEYVTLCEAIQEIQFDTSTDDDIWLRWTGDGEYTTKSAYRIQFEDTFSKISVMAIWKLGRSPSAAS